MLNLLVSKHNDYTTTLSGDSYAVHEINVCSLLHFNHTPLIIIYLIHISELRNVYLDDGRPSMRMRMCIVSAMHMCMRSKTRWPLDSGMFDQVLDQTIEKLLVES